MNKKIPFSPPDITEKEINSVIEVLKSGWITTGKKVKEFQERIKDYCNTKGALLLNSATAGLFLTLKFLNIKEGDEVITTPYTFAATSNVILHCNARPVFVDIGEDFNISPANIEKAITKKTKAIISVDYGGFPCDYEEILNICKNTPIVDSPVKRIAFISDSAHSFGAIYKGKKVGGFADFSVFSFHAVKNLTTAEGGCVTFNSIENIPFEDINERLKLLSLHGQSKDAFEKYANNSWYYEIKEIGYKFNMTDIQAAIGLSQFERYESHILLRRKSIFKIYNEILNHDRIILPPDRTDIKETSYHLYAIRIKDITEEERNKIIENMAEKGISLNVHYIPVVMHPAYKRLGYNIANYPLSYKTYTSEITLPVYSSLTDEDAYYVADEFMKTLKSFNLI